MRLFSRNNEFLLLTSNKKYCNLVQHFPNNSLQPLSARLISFDVILANVPHYREVRLRRTCNLACKEVYYRPHEGGDLYEMKEKKYILNV